MTKLDLLIEYKRNTGNYPEYIQDYIDWLEEEIIKLENLKKKFIPWEPMDVHITKQ